VKPNSGGVEHISVQYFCNLFNLICDFKNKNFNIYVPCLLVFFFFLQKCSV